MTETEPPIPAKPAFEIKSLDDFKRVMTIARGGDPDAIQAVTKFMDFDSIEERSYFPDKITTLCIGQLKGYSKLYYPNDDWDPFRLVADALGVSYMGYKGFKSEQFKDMTRTQPDLSGLQTSMQEESRGLLDKMLGRKKE